MGEMLAEKPNAGTLLRGDMMSLRQDTPTLADLGVSANRAKMPSFWKACSVTFRNCVVIAPRSASKL